MQFGPWLEKYREAGDLGQMAYLGQAWPTLDADGLLTLFEPGNAYAYYQNDSFASLIQEARSTTDREERLELYHQATEVMCDDPPVIFMFNQPLTVGISNRVDWTPRSDGWMRAFEMERAN